MGQDPRLIREEIARTREELGETVQALADKADVKARASEKVEEVKGNLKAKVTGAPQAAKEKVAGAAETAREKIGSGDGTGTAPAATGSAPFPGPGPSTTDRIGRITSEATTQLDSAAHSKPWALVAGAFALGIAVGLLVARRR